MKRSVAIAGGGLGGLACAKSLVDAGWNVEMLEALPFLGGRASTFRDSEGDWIEQGLHLFLGTYSEFKKLLEEIGQSPNDVLLWMSQVRLKDPEGPEAVFGSNPLTAPVKTLLSILGQNDFLGPADKLSLVPLSLPAVRSIENLERRFDSLSVTEWWRQSGGTDDVLERVLRPFCRAIQFTDAEEFSAYNFLAWIHHVTYGLPHSLLGSYQGARDELIFEPLGRYLTRHGARIRTSTRLHQIECLPDGRGSAFVAEDRSRTQADVFVVAVPPWMFSRFMPEQWQRDPFFQGIVNLPTAPAISVQLWFDGKVIESEDFILMARTVVPVYQDQCSQPYPFRRGSRISATISPADDYLDLTDAELVRLTVEKLASVEPLIRNSQVLKSVVLRHEHHLVRPLPGVMAARPPQTTPIDNVFVAGDWTEQDYFGSQEGAVRAGRRCAAAILEKYPSK